MRTDRIYTIVRHPSGEGWTWIYTPASYWSHWPSQIKRKKSYPTAIAAMLRIHYLGVPWQNIAWPLTTEPSRDILGPQARNEPG